MTSYVIKPTLLLLLFSCTKDNSKQFHAQNSDDIVNEITFVKKNEYVIKNASIISYNTNEFINFDILIENGIIKQISNNIVVSDSLYNIDATGKYIIPALFDMHTHASEENDFFLYVANGVTTVRHMWGSQRLLNTRVKRNNLDFIGPKMFIASAGFEQALAEWPGTNIISNPDNIDNQVLEQKRLGFDFIKVYENLTHSNYNWILQASNKHKLDMVGHLPPSVSLESVLTQHTQKSIEHIDHYLEYIGTNQSNINVPSTYQIDNDKMVDIASISSTSEVWNCPTITVTTRHAAQLQSLQNNPELQYVSPSMRSWFRLGNWDAPSYSIHKFKLIKALYDANAKLMLGTDAGLLYILPGFSVHEELKYFVDTGIPEIEALKIATKNCAEFLNLNQGAVEVGKNAELLILNQNPLEAISNTKNIHGVFTNGLWLNRAYIDAKLESIKSSYN